MRPFCLLLFSVILFTTLRAANRAHQPFAEGAEVELITLQKIEPMLESGTALASQQICQYRISASDAPFEQRLIVAQDSEGVEPWLYVYLDQQSGSTAAAHSNPAVPRWRFSDFSSATGLELYAAHLNQDATVDFVIIHYSGGNGIAAGYAMVGFLLSADEGYSLSVVESIYPDPSDFIRLNGKAVFLHCDLQNADPCRDGKAHNFWIYNVLNIEGDFLTIDNASHQMFPRTIFYSFAPSSAETELLEPSQKTELVARSAPQIRRRQERAAGE
ncbi:MAG: hypothetical protein ABS34_05275 [Opitutaceae bacterium BACL24 MAG-120322-bin51]|jgi:hypothetical protein|nr:MAG: hypothetical protein ABS34_05275 [Opitutaceae bacterium BACL24 MAG-120322-bin51]